MRCKNICNNIWTLKGLLKITNFTCGKPGRIGFACDCCDGWHWANAASAAWAAVLCNELAIIVLLLMVCRAAIVGVAAVAFIVSTAGSGSSAAGLLLVAMPMRLGEPSYSGHCETNWLHDLIYTYMYIWVHGWPTHLWCHDATPRPLCSYFPAASHLDRLRHHRPCVA